MGYSNRLPDMMAKWARERIDAKDVRDAILAIEQFNARALKKRGVVFWPTIGAALIAKHHWATILCRSCGTITDMDLRVKKRDAAQPVCVILSDMRCPRCNGHGLPQLIALQELPSV